MKIYPKMTVNNIKYDEERQGILYKIVLFGLFYLILVLAFLDAKLESIFNNEKFMLRLHISIYAIIPIIFVLLISTALNGQKIKNSARLITDRASLNYQ